MRAPRLLKAPVTGKALIKAQRFRKDGVFPESPLLPTDNEQGVTCGKIDGGLFDVTYDGASTYSIPLWVPDGRLGVQPALKLTYHSRRGNGLLGVGWSLSGCSSITVGKTTFSDDTTIEAVKFDQSDPFYLDGQRLILVSGVHGADGAEYRTKQDTFAKIILHWDKKTTPIFSPTWFEVFLKNGQILKYGDTGKNDSGARFEGDAIINSIAPGNWPPGSADKNDPINDQLLRDNAALGAVSTQSKWFVLLGH
jgi:hypothetical protein